MSDRFRPAFHFTPPSMWMNDPNGMVYFDGEYHLFYQYHPHSLVWGPMHWGHAVSKDMVNWQHLPIALHPDEHGMIFSGSAIVDAHNTAGFGKEAMIAIFTYNNHTYNDKKRVEDQNLAYSIDRGRTWTKYAGNPIVPHPGNLTDFRDPKVFWHEDHWVMALAAGDRVLFYISADLKHWKQSGTFGNGEYGSTVGVWETPDLFKLTVDTTTQTRWVLTVGVGKGGPAGGSGTQYFIGDFDGQTFTSEDPKETILWADHGADYYAPQSWNHEPNDRRIMLGWMNNWQYATTVPAFEFRGSFSLPRELSLTQTQNGIRLIQTPIPELQSLRGTHTQYRNEFISTDNDLFHHIRSETLEIKAEFQWTGNTDSFGFQLRVGANEETVISYLVAEQMLVLDRTRSGQADFNEGFARIHSAPLAPIRNTIRLHIFVDAASIEVFANDGILTLTDSIFPSPDSRGIKLLAQGGSVCLNELDIFELGSIQSINTEE